MACLETLSARRSAGSFSADTFAGDVANSLSGIAGGDEPTTTELELRKQLQTAEASAARSNDLFRRLAERFATLQRAIQEQRLEVDVALLEPAEPTSLGMQGPGESWREAGLTDEVRSELIQGPSEDKASMCERRLPDHAWRQAQEDRIESLGEQLAALEVLLGEAAESPAVASTSLLERVRVLEQCVDGLFRLKETRARELVEIQQQLEALRYRLGVPRDDPIETEGHGALSASAMTEARMRLKALEVLERERQNSLATALTRLSQRWDALGLAVPDELEAQEVQLLQGVEVLSEDLLNYCESREAALTQLHSDLERQVAGLRERLGQWRQCLEHFGLVVAEDSQTQLFPAIRVLRAATADAEIAASDFLQHEKVALQAFFESTQLPNVKSLLDEISCAPSSYVQQLEVLRQHWERTVLQRQDYRKIVDMIAAREALEIEMREFDFEASDRQRFRKRHYSGVEESRRRVEYQKQIRSLDASLQACSAEWEEREGLPFHINGVHYVCSENLNADCAHTERSACTGAQLAQQEALRSVNGFQPQERRRGEDPVVDRSRAGTKLSQSQQELPHPGQVPRCQSAPRGLRGSMGSRGSGGFGSGARRSGGSSIGRSKGRVGLGAPLR